jgi:hypothetical protein
MTFFSTLRLQRLMIFDGLHVMESCLCEMRLLPTWTGPPSHFLRASQRLALVAVSVASGLLHTLAWIVSLSSPFSLLVLGISHDDGHISQNQNLFAFKVLSYCAKAISKYK